MRIILAVTMLLSWNLDSIAQLSEEQKIIETLNSLYIDYCIQEKQWVGTQHYTPTRIVDYYVGWVNSRKASGRITHHIKFISDNRLSDMKEYYNEKAWSGNLWRSDSINFVNNIDQCPQGKMLRVSHPLFNKKRNKVLLFLNITSNTGSSFAILSFQHIDEKWKYIGRMPMGVGHK